MSKLPTTSPRLSAGVIVVRCIQHEYRYLLLRAYKNWDFPKGMVDADESPLDAARREVREETGLTDLNFRWADVFHETTRYADNKVARYYVALSVSPDVTLPISPELGRPEHHEYRWLAYDAAVALLVPRVRAALVWSRNVIGEGC